MVWSLKKQAVVLLLRGSLILGLGGCISLGGGEEKKWDFSRPYPSLPPARSPHREEAPAPLNLFGGINPSKWSDIFFPSPGGSRSTEGFAKKTVGDAKKGEFSPPSGAGWTKSSPLLTHNEGGIASPHNDTPGADLLFWQAEEAFRQNRNHLAYQYLEQAILSNPKDPLLWQKAILVALRANEPEMASQLASQALQRFPDHVFLWQAGALARYRMGDFAGAEQAARRAISLDNRCALSYFLVGAALHHQGQTVQAVGYLEQAARLDPRFARSSKIN